MHVVTEEFPELVVGDLSDEGRATAEGGDARRGVAGATAGDELRGAHMFEEPVGFLAVDQPHGPLHQAFPDQKILFSLRQNVDDRVSDRQHVELRLGHEPSLQGTTGGLANRRADGKWSAGPRTLASRGGRMGAECCVLDQRRIATT